MDVTTDAATFGAPVLTPPTPADGKWEREYRAFLATLPELLREYRGQYVALHEGRVVGHGTDKVAVALDACRTYGLVEILVRLVTDEPPRVVSIPSPRRVPPGAA